MADQQKEEFPPLMPEGFHPRTLAQVRLMCVEAFPDSATRKAIMDGLEAFVALTAQNGVSGEMWINGSFATTKPNPSDVDFVLFVPHTMYENGSQAQKLFLDSMNNGPDSRRAEYRDRYLCDTHCICDYPVGSPFYPLTLATRRHWDKETYGRSVGTGEPKGILVIEIAATEAATRGAR